MEAINPRKQYLKVGSIIITVILIIVGIGFFVYSGPPAEIVLVTHNPLQPSSEDRITIEVSIIGGAQLFGRPEVDVGFGKHINGTSAGSGGASIPYRGNNEYNTEIGPFKNGTILWYVVRVTDRGNHIFSNPNQLQIGNNNPNISFNVSMSTITPMWSHDQTDDSITAIFLISVNTTEPIEGGAFSLIGFTPDGASFGFSGSITYLNNNTYSATKYPDKLYWVPGTEIFYRFSFRDGKGAIFLSEVESTIIE